MKFGIKKPSPIEVSKKANEIIELIQTSNDYIEYKCNDGSVFINCHTLNFTYSGNFGSAVNNLNIKTNIEQDINKKIICLASMLELYAYNNGGFNVRNV